MDKKAGVSSRFHAIRPYHLTMSEWDKNLNVNVFTKPELEKTECTILVAIDTYDIDINNLEIRLVVQ